MNKITFAAKAAESYHNNLLALSKGVQSAGGSVCILDPKLTLHDMLVAFATNGIKIETRFERATDDE